jgi:hypothetical protein
MSLRNLQNMFEARDLVETMAHTCVACTSTFARENTSIHFLRVLLKYLLPYVTLSFEYNINKARSIY